MPTVLERLESHRGQVPTPSGPASYIDTGGPGRPALFLHGASAATAWGSAPR